MDTRGGMKDINKSIFSCSSRARVNSPALELTEVRRVGGYKKQTSSGLPRDECGPITHPHGEPASYANELESCLSTIDRQHLAY